MLTKVFTLVGRWVRRRRKSSEAENQSDMKTALSAVSSGDGLTAKYQAKYMAASMNTNASADRNTDSDDAGDALDGADSNTDTQAASDSDKLADEIANDFCAHMGFDEGSN